MGVAALHIVIGVVTAAAPDSFVLLKPSSTLFPAVGITTDAGTKHWGCCESGDKTITARFVADDGDFIEIETLGREPDATLHCGATYSDNGAFDHQLFRYQLRVRVRRSDVATVLRAPIHTGWADVAAGLPVEMSDGGMVFGLYGTTRDFVLPMPESAAGLTYTPSRWKALPDATHAQELRLLSGLVAPVGDGGTIWLLPGETWPRSAGRVQGEETVLSVSAPCARLKTRVPSEALMTLKAEGKGGYGTIGLCAAYSENRIRAGAKVFWPDGRVAGVLRRADGLWGPTWSGDGGTICANTTLQGVEGSLPLWFRPEDVPSLRSKP